MSCWDISEAVSDNPRSRSDYARGVNRIIRIADLHDRVFLRMPEVLASLPPEASTLRWHILDLGDVLANDGSDLNVPEIEERVLASQTRLALSFEELTDFAQSARQVIDGLFVATSPGARPPRRELPDADIVDQSVAVVAAWDSSFWLVSGPNSWLSRIAATFDHVHEEAIGATPLRAWGPAEG